MKKQKIIFLSPDNETVLINYDEVLDFCKDLCLKEENIKEFEVFKKDYTYFNPYFDFVMFKLNYIFINPLFKRRYGLFHFNNALYLYPVKSFNYDECFNYAYGLFIEDLAQPFMTSVSDSELGIKKANSSNTGDAMIDSNLYAMMSKSGTISGSHATTCNSILNQLLISSTLICNSFFEEKDKYLDFENSALNYIVGHLAFLRAANYDIYPMLIGNNSVLDNEQNDFVCNCIKNGYNYFNLDDLEAKSYVKEYKKIIKKD